MGFQDRNYNQTGNQGGFGSSYGGGGFGGGGMHFSLGILTPAVKMLLIINLAAFVVQHLLGPHLAGIIPDELKVELFGGQQTDRGWIFPIIKPNGIEAWFSVIGFSPKYAFQLWRLLTFQFLHADVMHIVFNMLGVFFLGPVLERSWGTKKFLTMYLVSGAVGGALYSLASLFGIFGHSMLIGASGGVLALLVACAVLFPHFQVILFIFPVPIRFACGLFTLLYILNVIGGGHNAGGDLCHLGGMATGFLWVMGRPKLDQFKTNLDYKVSQKRKEEVKNLEYEVDRILAKVHEQGIQSLTKREREILKKATEMQKKH